MALSIIVPTYNESENILKLIEAIRGNVPRDIYVEILIVDDNSPDGTGTMVENYINGSDPPEADDRQQKSSAVVKVLHRKSKNGLIPAILEGIHASRGENILVMDADFSHPPDMIPRMFEKLLQDSGCDLVVASRYVDGGSVEGWPLNRRLLSRSATNIARHGLKISGVKDPMSGFFLFRRHVIESIAFDTRGYKILLEILVKAEKIQVREIPYTFTNRRYGESKLRTSVALDYLRSVWRLYRYGRKSKQAAELGETRKSVLFFSKAARFYTVGASGLLVNYLASLVLSNGILSSFFYIHAATIGIICSITSNFFLNKVWTFEDTNFAPGRTVRQYGMYAGFSTIGAVLQLSLLYVFVQSYGINYALALVLAVGAGSIGNFLFNKKWTFGERIWG